MTNNTRFIIDTFVKYMKENSLSDLTDHAGHQTWKDLCLLVNKKTGQNEQKSLHYLYNKNKSPIKKAIQSEFIF